MIKYELNGNQLKFISIPEAIRGYTYITGEPIYRHPNLTITLVSFGAPQIAENRLYIPGIDRTYDNFELYIPDSRKESVIKLLEGYNKTFKPKCRISYASPRG